MIDAQVPRSPQQRLAVDDDVVRLERLTKSSGSLRAVDALSLEIQRGENVALLEPNGAGKTTTTSMLLAPDSGAVRVLGLPPAAAILSGQVGAMLQEGNLIPGVRVGELLDYVLGLRPGATSRQQLIAIAGLQGLERRRVDRLSGGQTQRLRFALAIASDPEVLVLDEPTAAMDVGARCEFWASMRGYTSSGRTVLFATHYLEEAEAFASRVVIVSHGHFVADGTFAALTRGVGMQTVQFTFSSDAQPSRMLAELDGVCQVEVDHERVTLKTSDADATMRALAASAIAWKDLEVRRANLEDVFLALAGGNGGNGGNNQ